MNILQPLNPTDDERHNLLKIALNELNRPEDYNSIIDSTSPPTNITSIMPANSCKGTKVGIIGGGSSGLAAAYELQKLGFDITILEGEKERIGGRIYTHYFSEQLYGELGPMRLPVSHETVWHYINLFNLKTNPYYLKTENNILFVQNTGIRGKNIDDMIKKYIYPKYDLSPLAKQMPLSNLISYILNSPIVNLNPKTRQSILKILRDDEYPEEIIALDNMDLRTALKYLGLKHADIKMLTSVLGVDRNLLYNSYLELIREEYSANYSYMYEITGGSKYLVRAFINALQTKSSDLGRVAIKQGRRVMELYNDQVKNKITLSYLDEYTKQQNAESFDYVICTIPFSTLRIVETNPEFSNAKKNSIREVNYAPSQKSLILFKERFWERTINGKRIIGGSAVTDLAVNTVWYPSHQYHSEYGVITASYNINLDATRIGNLDDELRFYTIKRQLEKIHGLEKGYLDRIAIDYKTVNWNKPDLYLGAFCVYNPGQTRVFSYPSVEPEFNGKVFFAGEHTTPFHAWIQGSLQSGMIAANSVAYACLEALKK